MSDEHGPDQPEVEAVLQQAEEHMPDRLEEHLAEHKDDPVPVVDDSPKPDGEVPAPVVTNGLTDAERERLQFLRVNGAQSEAEAAEMEALALKEHDAAGHAVPEPPPEPSEADHLFAAVEHLVSGFKAMASLLPAGGSLGGIIAAAEARLRAARDALTAHYRGEK